MFIRRIALFLTGFLLSVPSQAGISDSIKVTKDPIGIAFGEKCKLSICGYGQTNYELYHDNQQTQSDFQVKRVILIGNATVGKHLMASVMVDVASSQSNRRLHEYFMQWNFCDELKIRVGQYKQPFMLESIYAPIILGAVNMTEGTKYMAGIAGDALQGAMVGRDIGIMATGECIKMTDGHKLLNYSLGIFNGSGLNTRDNNNAKDLIGMIQLYPVREWMITSSFIIGRGHALAHSPYGDIKEGDNYNRNRLSVGTELHHKPLMIRSEYTNGWNGSVRSTAFYVETWLTLLPKLDLVVNYDYLNRNRELTREQQRQLNSYTESQNWTVGLQYWLWKQCRVASQYVYQSHHAAMDSQQWITQFQFAF